VDVSDSPGKKLPRIKLLFDYIEEVWGTYMGEEIVGSDHFPLLLEEVFPAVEIRSFAAFLPLALGTWGYQLARAREPTRIEHAESQGFFKPRGERFPISGRWFDHTPKNFL